MIIGHSRSALLVCTAMVLLSASGVSYAQDAAQATQADGTVLNKIVVKGKRTTAANAASDTPLASQTTADEIRKKEISNARDLGNTTEPGVDFVESKPGKPGGLFIRGLGGARVTTLIDNIPVPFFENYARSTVATTGMSDTSNSYDFSSLSSVDVVRGSDSSRIGPGALGGALVLRTLEPEDLIGEGRDWGGVAKLTYDSEDRSFGGNVAVAKKVQNTSVLFQGGYKKGHERDNQGTADIIGASRTKANPADYDQYNLLFKLRQDLEGGHRIGVTAERFNLDNKTDLKTLQTATFTGATAGSTNRVGDYWGYDDTRRDRVSLDYQYEAPSADAIIDSADLTLYWQKLAKDAGSYGRRNNGTDYGRYNQMEESSVGLTGSALSEFSTGNLNHEVRFGGNLQFFQTEQFIRVVPAGSVVSQSDIPDVDGRRLGFYVDDRISFGETGFALTPGARLDWYDYDPKASAAFRNNTGFSVFGLPEGQDGVRISPKLLATYQLTPEVELFGQWSMAYRPPTVNELYINFTNPFGPGGGYANIGNPDLKPETSQGFEIGANYQSNELNGKITLYHNVYSNFIDVFGTPGGVGQPGTLYTWGNRDKVEISGVEVSARKDFANGIFLHGSLAYSYGKDKNTGEFIRTVAPFKSILGVGYEQETWGADLSTILSGGMRDEGRVTPITGPAFAYDTFDAPGYGIVNLTGWWEPKKTNGLRIQAGVYNIFDKTYYNAVGVRDVSTSGAASTSNQPVAFYSEPGRTFKISLTQKF